MREIVHIQAGQCGNQIGAKVSTTHFMLLRISLLQKRIFQYWFVSATVFETCMHNVMIQLDMF